MAAGRRGSRGVTASIANELAVLLGDGRVETGEAALDARRHDYWAVSHVRDLRGDPAPRPACVVRPACAADVQATLRFASERAIPVIPFGLGSGGVGGGMTPPGALRLGNGGLKQG